MRNFTSIRTGAAYLMACVSVLLALTATTFAQTAPTLGTSSTYGAFTGNGAIGNTGLTMINGDIGTFVGSFTGFPPGQYTGAKHVADAAALTAKNDVTLAYNSLNDATHAVMFDTALNATMGNGQVLTPRTYGRGDLTTLSGDLTFDAKGNSAAVFIIKIRAALNVSKNTHILLANGAQAANIYWAVDGAVSILDNSIFKGTILSNGAIHLYGGSTLEGRALAVVGAVTFASNIVTVPGGSAPGNNLAILTPAPGDSVGRGQQNYQITWGGTGIGAVKTIEYSLDSGATWTLIGVANGDVFAYSWNVPDTSSTKAMIRITDNNNLRGVSGIFKIGGGSGTPGTIVVTHPAAGEVLTGGTTNYQITWTGTAITPHKTFELSLDNGVTWKSIGTVTGDVMTFSWNVPDTATTTAVIRITDDLGATGRSGAFTITSTGPTPGTLVILHPTTGESIDGGTTNYQITFTATNITPQKTIEYSLDGGATWTLIGFMNSDALSYVWSTVPNVATTQARIRITDANGAVGMSGLFTIKLVAGVGSINSLTLSGLDGKNNIGNNKQLGISWTFTPDIGTTVEVEYSLDYMASWIHIATVNTTESPNTSWTTPATGYVPSAFIRVTSSKGMTRTSTVFSIGTNASVISDIAANGYAVSNYPNPATDRVTFKLVLPVAADVRVTVFNNEGVVVRTIATQHLDAGTQEILLNTFPLSSGTYSCIVQAGSTTLISKMTVVR